MIEPIPPIDASAAWAALQRGQALPVEFLPTAAPDPASVHAFERGRLDVATMPEGSQGAALVGSVEKLQIDLARQLDRLTQPMEGVPEGAQNMMNMMVQAHMLSLQVSVLSNAAQQIGSGVQTLFKQQN